jgi:hypothetical protein
MAITPDIGMKLCITGNENHDLLARDNSSMGTDLTIKKKTLLMYHDNP